MRSINKKTPKTKASNKHTNIHTDIVTRSLAAWARRWSALSCVTVSLWNLSLTLRRVAFGMITTDHDADHDWSRRWSLVITVGFSVQCELWSRLTIRLTSSLLPCITLSSNFANNVLCRCDTHSIDLVSGAHGACGTGVTPWLSPMTLTPSLLVALSFLDHRILET